jgi:signal transduction histidine kinase
MHSDSNNSIVATRALNSRWASLLELMRRHPVRTDALLAVVSVVAIAFSTVANRSLLTPEQDASVAVWANPLALVAVGLLVFRRLFPEVQFILTTGLYIAAGYGKTTDDIVGIVAIWISFYGIGAYGGRWRNWIRLVGAIAVAIALATVEGAGEPVEISGPQELYYVAITMGFVASAWLFGDTIRIRRQQALDLELRARELESERDHNALRAVTEERLRIARELHDVMAHHVTVIGVQATAATRVLEKDPAVARMALASIATASRETIGELQRLLGFLRSDQSSRSLGAPFGDVVPESPQPELADIGKLITDSQAVGLSVELRISGDLGSLPGSVSLSGYRIVQEALTNVHRHAPRAHTTVDVARNSSSIVIRVVNTATPGISTTEPGGPKPSTSTGHGIVGIRERVRLVGGELRYGPLPGGGWSLEAELPLAVQPMT